MVLEVQSVRKSFADSDGPVPVLQDVSFDLKAGQTLALTGESGSGKSTLLHIVAGLEAPDTGAVRIGGNDLTQMDDAGRAMLRRADIALIFQQFNLIPSLTVGANISFQARLSDRHDTAHIERLVQALGLADHMRKYPETLSGGQQQRVAIARALAAKPKLLLADEPTGNLDEGTADDVLAQMLLLVAQTGAAMMVVHAFAPSRRPHGPTIASATGPNRMIRACLGALLSHWRRNPIQLFAYLAGLVLATALWSGVQAINSEARASYDAAATTLGEGQFDQLVPRQGQSISQDTYIKLRRAGWRASPVIEGRLGDVRLVGIDPLTAPGGFGALATPAGTPVLDFSSEPQLFANTDTAALLPDGLKVTVNTNIAPGVAIGDISAVQELLDRTDLSRFTLQAEQPMNRPPLATLVPALRLQPAQQTADIGQLTDSFHMNLTAFGLLSFAVGLFIVHSTIGLAFEQRRGMIRTLRSLGVPLRTLVTLITIEMLTLATIGAFIGIVLGYLIAAVLLPDVAATLRGLYGAEISGSLQIRAEWWLSGLLIAVLGTAAALAGRIWQIARMPLLASVRPRAWAMASDGRFKLQMLSAGTLLLAALALVLFGAGLMSGFAALGCLLIGAALALPVISGAILSRFEKRANAPLWGWFWADTRQQLPGLSLALMALLLAVAANIGVSTMVSSFRLTFVSFLDQRLAPELFVQVENADQSTALETYLTDNTLEILPLLRVDGHVAGHPVALYGVRVGDTYRNSWVFLDQTLTPWDTVEAGQGVILNEQLARRSDLWINDTVAIAPDLTLPIVAVVGDYGNPQGQVVMSETLFRTLHPDQSALQFGIRTPDAPALRTALTETLNIPNSAIIDQAAIKAISLDVFERTFTVTAALNVLTLLVAGFAILMSLLTLADLRVPQLAPVWALGMTRRTLGWLELLRTIALVALVFLCALPLGLALAWVLLSIVNVEAFGWQLPMYLFPLDYLQLGGYAFIAAVLAALWPAVRLMRTPPSSLLKVFANER